MGDEEKKEGDVPPPEVVGEGAEGMAEEEDETAWYFKSLLVRTSLTDGGVRGKGVPLDSGIIMRRERVDALPARFHAAPRDAC